MFSAMGYIAVGVVLIITASIFSYALGLLFRWLMILGALALLYGLYRYRVRRWRITLADIALIGVPCRVCIYKTVPVLPISLL